MVFNLKNALQRVFLFFFLAIPIIYYVSSKVNQNPVIIINIFSFVLSFLVILIISSKDVVFIKSSNLFGLYIIGLYFCYSVMNFFIGNISFLMVTPLVAYFGVVLRGFSNNSLSSSHYLNMFYFYLIILILAQVGIEATEASRKVGFFNSSTEFSVWLYLVSFIVMFLNDRKRVIQFFISFVCLFLIAESQTRSVLALSILTTLYWLLKGTKPVAIKIFHSRRFRFFFLLAFPSFMVFIFSNNLVSNFLSLFQSRLENGVDYSYASRLGFYNYSWSLINSGGFLEFLFGNGLGTLRQNIVSHYGEDFQAHNDFLAILHDTGVLGLVVFSYSWAKLGGENDRVFLLVVFYFFSAFHNMLSSFNIVFFIFFVSLILKKEEHSSR